MLHIPHSRKITDINQRIREREIKARNESVLIGLTGYRSGKDSCEYSGFGKLHLYDYFETSSLNVGIRGGNLLLLLKIREYHKIINFFSVTYVQYISFKITLLCLIQLNTNIPLWM